MIQTRTITAIISDFNGEPLENALVAIRHVGQGNGPNGAVAPGRIEFYTDATGRVAMPLWENNGTYSDTHYEVSSYHPSTNRKIHDAVEFRVFDSDAFLHDLVDLSPIEPENPTQANLDQMTADRAAVAADRAAVAGELTTIQAIGQQVASDADLVAQDKQTVADDLQQVKDNAQLVVDAVADAQGEAQQAAASAAAAGQDRAAVADDKQAVSDYRDEVEASRAQVASNKTAVDAAALQVTNDAAAVLHNKNLTVLNLELTEEARDAAESAKAQTQQDVIATGQSANYAMEARDLAQDWAAKTSGPVANGNFSAKQYALDCQQIKSDTAQLKTDTDQIKTDTDALKQAALNANTSAQEAKELAESYWNNILENTAIPMVQMAANVTAMQALFVEHH